MVASRSSGWAAKWRSRAASLSSSRQHRIVTTFCGRLGEIDASSFESRLSAASFVDRLFQFSNALFKLRRLDDFGERLHHFCQLAGLRRRQVAVPNRFDKGTHSRNRVVELLCVADRGYFSSAEILACHEAGITVTLPKPMTSVPNRRGALASRTLSICRRRSYRCPAGEQCHIASRARKTAADKALLDQRLSRLLAQVPVHAGPERRIPRWEHEHLSKLCSSALMQTHKPCASVARRSSIRSAR